MSDIPFQRLIYHAPADFTHRRMTHRSLGVGGYGFGGPRACPRGSMLGALCLTVVLAATSLWGADVPVTTAPSGGAPELSLTEINKKLTNPVSDFWSISFQQNNLDSCKKY